MWLWLSRTWLVHDLDLTQDLVQKSRTRPPGPGLGSSTKVHDKVHEKVHEKVHDKVYDKVYDGAFGEPALSTSGRISELER